MQSYMQYYMCYVFKPMTHGGEWGHSFKIQVFSTGASSALVYWRAILIVFLRVYTWQTQVPNS
jgi:hypothetical protein